MFQTFFVDSTLLYELCSLNIEGFDPQSLFNRTSSMDLMMFASRWAKEKTYESKLEANCVDVDLPSVLSEAGGSLLTSPHKVRDLLLFYRTFDHVQTATFLLSVVAPDSYFKKQCDEMESHQKQTLFQMLLPGNGRIRSFSTRCCTPRHQSRFQTSTFRRGAGT